MNQIKDTNKTRGTFLLMLALCPRAPLTPSSHFPPETKQKTHEAGCAPPVNIVTRHDPEGTDPEGLLEGSGLVLGVLGDGGVGAGAFAAPHLLGAGRVPVLVGRLRELRPDLHQVLRVRLHQRLCGEQTQICRGG